MKNCVLLISLLLALCITDAGARNKYLFVYFTGNDPVQE